MSLILGRPRDCLKWPSRCVTPPSYDTQSGLLHTMNFRAVPESSPINLGPHKYRLCHGMPCSHWRHTSSYCWKLDASPFQLGTPSLDRSMVPSRLVIPTLVSRVSASLDLFQLPLFRGYHASARGALDGESVPRWSTGNSNDGSKKDQAKAWHYNWPFVLEPHFTANERADWWICSKYCTCIIYIYYTYGFHKLGYPNSWMLWNGKSYWNGWFGGTLF